MYPEAIVRCGALSVNLARVAALCAGVAVLLAAAPPVHVFSQSPSAGPDRGWLVLHGGGTTRDHGATQRFASLAGGENAHVVVILTPLDQELLTTDFLAQYKKWWAGEFGLTHVTFMDTRKREEADAEAFVAPLRDATGVWIVGGHLSTLLDVYLGTRAEREIKAVVERGGALGGASAGAMVQGSFLVNVTKTPSGQRLPKSRMFLDQAHLVGFGLLRNTAVYPHFSARQPERDLVEVAARYPGLLVVGIDEDTAMIVHESRGEVIGNGKVWICGSRERGPKRFLELARGQRFDFKARSGVH
jgi:cyanophycinase